MVSLYFYRMDAKMCISDKNTFDEFVEFNGAPDSSNLKTFLI